VVIDPVSRIEGHLRIEVEVSANRVTRAWSSATLFRGIEPILNGRNPHDAPIITQRLCGVCTYVHQICSVRAIENAVNATITDNARIVRNLTLGAQFLHDHVVHFYQLHGLTGRISPIPLPPISDHNRELGPADQPHCGSHRLRCRQGPTCRSW
jgi:[NiFe] hydrogenase large subunit